MQAAMRPAAWIIVVAAVIGIVLSTVSLVAHYRTDESTFCDINESFNCDYVNRSEYSQIGPIPVAGIGLAGYIFLLALTRYRTRSAAWLRLACAALGLAFALYLTYIEKYVLAVWCILCLGSLGMISLITAASGVQAFATPLTRTSSEQPIEINR
jgi:vitamin-K-epoxide reductase (warfarin-sensitive)